MTPVQPPETPETPETTACRVLARDAGGGPTAAAVPVRVRYAECDPMRVAHHSVYATWFELARTELLRARGLAYRECEAAGVFFVGLGLDGDSRIESLGALVSLLG